MLTPATITVTFKANYAGPHRICWRQCNVGSYICTNIVECAGGGNVCSATISIMVDPESCAQVCFEGYIQATCNPEGSVVDQVLWTTSFIPNPICTTYNITCVGPMGSFCQPFDGNLLGLNCDGTSRPIIGPIHATGPGVPLSVCASTLVSNLPNNYVMSLNGSCCYDCSQYDLTFSLLVGGDYDGTTVYYTDCTTRELIRLDYSILLPPPSPLTLCAVNNSIFVEYDPLKVAVSTINVGTCP